MVMRMHEWDGTRTRTSELLATLLELYASATDGVDEAISTAVGADHSATVIGALPRVPAPALSAMVLALQHLTQVQDHVSALATLAAAPGKPVHSRYTLARAALESAGRAVWLLEDVDWPPRVSRFLALMSQGVEAAIRFIRQRGHEPPEWPLESRHMHEAAAALGVQLPGVPSKRQFAALVVGGHPTGTDEYSRLSGLIHGEAVALQDHHEVAINPDRWPATYARGWILSANTSSVALSAAILRLTALLHPASVTQLWDRLRTIIDEFDVLGEELTAAVDREEALLSDEA
jgi:hypothetical protein